jgi:hypothetical protein
MFETVSDYYAAVARLGLVRTVHREVFVTADGTVYSVPNPARYSVQQRARIIELLTVKVRGYDADLPSNAPLETSARNEIHGE